MMEVLSEKKGEITIIRLKANVLDANNANTFKEKVSPILNQGKRIVLCLDDVSFIDSTGCGALLSCLRKINTNAGVLKFSGVQKPLRSLFELFRLNRVIDMYKTADEALNAF